ncbi:quercetin dioxygenase-like cupin family protein/ligand-binding sensor protein [Bacilli bacterium PM5-9]|nr:quercetin dioxygenase-like cupin family protein/ligand-binding sensor protein [Bacilli bacterium PM5-9]
MIQKTDWGYIEWLHTPRSDSEVMNIGITVVFPNQKLPLHTHYGTEQFLFVMEGEGYYVINGERKDFKAGSSFYLEADSTHETHNLSNQCVKELLISTPVQYNADIFDAKESSKDNLFNDAVIAVYNQSLSNLKIPYTILDNKDNIVFQNDFFPNYCKDKCQYKENTCECLSSDKGSLIDNEFICSKGLDYYSYPIQVENVYLGCVIGGHILLSDSYQKNADELYDTPKSTALSIKKLLKQLSKNITNIYEFSVSKKELLEKDKRIDLSKIKEQELENSVTNLKINHHFLFNTLNSMADIALQSDNDNLYNSIISLSKIFRYTMSSELKIMPLKFEIEYLDDYLNLQKLRYQETLQVNYEINEQLLDVLIPFNFLQPIVENAFTHGLIKYNSIKVINVKIAKENNRLIFRIENNGKHIDDKQIDDIKLNMRMKTNHGLSFIYDKLYMVYQDDFIINIESDDKYTTIIIDIPLDASEVLK